MEEVTEWAKKFDILPILDTLEANGFNTIWVIKEITPDIIESLNINNLGSKMKSKIAIKSLNGVSIPCAEIKPEIKPEVENESKEIKIILRHCGFCHMIMQPGHKSVCKTACCDYNKCLYLKGHPDIGNNVKNEKLIAKKMEMEKKSNKKEIRT